MSGNRRFIRYPINDSSIHARTICGIDVTIFNASLLGLTIGHSRRLAPGGDYLVVLSGEWGALDLKAEILWQKETGSRNAEDPAASAFMSELRFIDVLTGKGEDLLSILEEDGQKSSSGLVGWVKKLGRVQRAMVMEFMTCPIHNLSLGGMLIERPICLEMNDRLPIEILRPGWNDVLVRGRVASRTSHETEGGELFRMGIEFDSLTDSDWSHLNNIVEYVARPAA